MNNNEMLKKIKKSEKDIVKLDEQLDKKANKSDIGSPLVASTISQMTDKTKVYVYTGNENGYINGNWYSWNGTYWVSGGVYNSIAIADESINIAKLDEYLNLNLNKLNLFNFKWINRAFDNNTHEPSTTENLRRIVSSKIKLNKNSIITMSKSFSFDIFEYNSDLTFKTEHGFTNYFEVKNDMYARIYIKKIDENFITDLEASNNIKIYNNVNQVLEEINQMYPTVQYNWANKGCTNTGEQTSHEVLKRVSSDLIRVNIGDEINSSNDNIVFIVYKFDINQKLIELTGYVSNYTIETDGYVRLLVKKITDNNISPNEVNGVVKFNNINSKIKKVNDVLSDNIGLINCVWFNKGMNGTTGEISSNSNIRLTSQLVRAKKGTSIKAKHNYSIAVFYYDDNLNFIEETSMVNKVDIYQDGWIRILLKNNNNETLMPTEIKNYLDFTKINRIQEKHCISNPTSELLAHVSRSVIDNKGNVYTVYLANDEIEAEDHLTINSTYIAISKFNQATPTNVKTNKLLFTSQEFDNGFINSTHSPYEPGVAIFNGMLYVLYRAYDGNKWSIRMIKVDMDNLTFDNNSYETFIDYKGNKWGLDEPTLNAINDKEGNGYTSHNALLVSNIINNGNDYYVAIGGYASNFSCFLLKTTDFINFTFMSAAPMTNKIKIFEPTIVYKTGKILVAGRNGELCSYNIETNTWSKVVTLPNHVESRPFFFRRMGHIFLARNKKGYYYDMGQNRIQRGCIEILLVKPDDLSKYVTVYEEIDYEGIHYFTILTNRDECYVIYSTDMRKINIAKCIGNLAYRKLGMY